MIIFSLFLCLLAVVIAAYALKLASDNTARLEQAYKDSTSYKLDTTKLNALLDALDADETPVGPQPIKVTQTMIRKL